MRPPAPTLGSAEPFADLAALPIPAGRLVRLTPLAPSDIPTL